MKPILLSLFMIHCLAGLCQMSDQEIYDHKAGRVEEDTSYVYVLPYEAGRPGKWYEAWRIDADTNSLRFPVTGDWKPGTILEACQCYPFSADDRSSRFRLIV